MAQLNQVTKRLQTALDGLEQVVESRAAGSGADDAALREALNTMQKKNAALQKVADTTATRLDTTIARLKSTLES